MRSACVALLAVGLFWVPAASARSVVDVLRDPVFGELVPQLEALAPALARTVAATYPVSSASSSVSYRFDPAQERFVRRPGPLGPLFGERARTIGRERLDLGLAYYYVRVDEIDGRAVSALGNQARVAGRFLTIPVGRRILADGRFTEVLPQQTTLDLNVDAHIVALNATYGVTAEWDVNVYLPLVTSSFDLGVQGRVPDPRFPEFSLAPGQPPVSPIQAQTSESAFGVGDLQLRTKYVFLRREPLDLAAALSLSLPTGSSRDLHGTGTTFVEPLLVMSRLFEDRWEPFLNVGVSIDAEDIDRSALRWNAGLNARIVDAWTASFVVLGRHEFSAPEFEIADAFFFELDRSDIIDGAAALRWLAHPSVVLSAGVQFPINDDGVRTAVTPTIQVEYLH